MAYEFKKAEELAWAAAIAAGVFALQVLAAFEPEKVTDWKAWAIALGAGALRAAAGAVLARRNS